MRRRVYQVWSGSRTRPERLITTYTSKARAWWHARYEGHVRAVLVSQEEREALFREEQTPSP